MGRKENPVEQRFVHACEVYGGVVRKVTYQGRKGAPDRWSFFPEERLLIVEAKAPGEKPEPLQLEEMRTLRTLGFWVAWGDTEQKMLDIVEGFVNLNRSQFNAAFPF